MSSFSKFLKEKQVLDSDIIGNEPHFFVISVRDLGEYAWRKIERQLDWDVKLGKLSFDRAVTLSKEHEQCLYWEIAVACLGSKEVERRLKGVKE